MVEVLSMCGGDFIKEKPQCVEVLSAAFDAGNGTMAIHVCRNWCLQLLMVAMFAMVCAVQMAGVAAVWQCLIVAKRAPSRVGLIFK